MHFGKKEGMQGGTRRGVSKILLARARKKRVDVGGKWGWEDTNDVIGTSVLLLSAT